MRLRWIVRAWVCLMVALAWGCGGDEGAEGERDVCATLNPPSSCDADALVEADAATPVDDTPECTPRDEICNGVDDDCDEIVDEDFDVGEACVVGVGACEAAGVMACAADGSTRCDAVPGEPAVDICDGVDNDCDGVVDGDFPDLGMSCSVGQGACAATGVFVCASDGLAARCDATAGAPETEVCDGIDNDCNGVVDDNASDRVRYFLDCDGDGFAATTQGAVMACDSPSEADARSACGKSSATWTSKSPTNPANRDCQDDHPDVHPGQVDYFPDPYPHGAGGMSYDYDCDGEETRQFTEAGVGSGESCSTSCLLSPFDACGREGWGVSVVMNCGQTATFRACEVESSGMCSVTGKTCNGTRTSSMKTQPCR